MRTAASSLILLSLCAGLAAQQAEIPSSLLAATRVSVLFGATDKSGNPVSDLTKEQVVVLDNNVPAEALEVRNASELPLHLGIVLRAGKRGFDQQQNAALELVQKLGLRSNVDKVFVLTAGGDKPWPNPRIEWNSDPQALAATIKGLDKNAGLPDAFNFEIKSSDTAENRMTVESFTGSGFSVFDALWAMMKTDPRPARRAVVMFRSGIAHSPGFNPQVHEAVDRKHDNIIAMAQSTGTFLFTIALPEAPVRPANLSQVYVPMTSAGQGGALRVRDEEFERDKERMFTAGRANVERLAIETGGRMWASNKKNFTDAVAGVLNALRGQYALTFVPSSAASTGQTRLLKIQAKGRELNISARKAYFPPEPLR